MLTSLSLLTDIEVLRRPLNTTLFPEASSDVTAHSGFADEHEKTASTILAETQRLIAANGATSVNLVSNNLRMITIRWNSQPVQIGHSLGAALAQLDALSMSMILPSDIAIKGVTYGNPRVGNSAYAALFDSKARHFLSNIPDVDSPFDCPRCPISRV